MKLMQNINDIMARVLVPPHEVTVSPCVRDLLLNLTLGPDGTAFSSPQQSGPSSVQQGPGGPGVSAAGNRVSPALSSPHLSTPLMNNPHTTQAPSSVSSSVVSSAGGVNTTSGGPHFGGPQHMQQTMGGTAGGMNIGNMQPGMGNIQQPTTMASGMMQPGGPRGGPGTMHSMGGMQGQIQGGQPGGFQGGMMNQFNR